MQLIRNFVLELEEGNISKCHKYDGLNFEEWAVRLSATFIFSLGLSLSINLKFLGSKIQ